MCLGSSVIYFVVIFTVKIFNTTKLLNHVAFSVVLMMRNGAI